MRKENHLPLSVADQLNYLFEVIQHPDNRPFTELEVAKGAGVSFSTINHIRTGRSINPAITTMKCLVKFFNVPLSYFEAETYEECRAIIAGERLHRYEFNDAINQLALHAIQVSPEGLQQVLQIIGWVQAAERERQRENVLN